MFRGLLRRVQNEAKWIGGRIQNEAKYAGNVLNAGKDLTVQAAKDKLKERERQADVIRQVPGQVKRLYDHKNSNLAVGHAQRSGDDSRLTDEEFEKSIPIGTIIKEGGKQLYWSGENYGWQSKGSYLKLEKEGQFRGGEVAAQRLNNDLGQGIQTVLGEDTTKRIGLAIKGAGDFYNENAPQQVKDAVNWVGGAAGAGNEWVSKNTNIGPTVTGELLTEAALLGGGQAIKAGGRTLRAAKPVSRAQELLRDVTGKGAKALDTGGSVGAAGAPLQAGRTQLLRNADPVTGPRIGGGVPAAQDRMRAAAGGGRQTIPVNRRAKPAAVEAPPTRAEAPPARVEPPAPSRVEQLQTRVRERNVAAEAGQGAGIQRARSVGRNQQARANEIRIRQQLDETAGAAGERRYIDAQQATRPGARGSVESEMSRRATDQKYDVVYNSDRVPISQHARRNHTGRGRSGSENLRVRAPRNRNTINPDAVESNRSLRSARGLQEKRLEQRLDVARRKVAKKQEQVASRNRLAGKNTDHRVNTVRQRGNAESARLGNKRRTKRNKAAEDKSRRAIKNEVGTSGYDTPNLPVSTRRNMTARDRLFRETGAYPDAVVTKDKYGRSVPDPKDARYSKERTFSNKPGEENYVVKSDKGPGNRISGSKGRNLLKRLKKRGNAQQEVANQALKTRPIRQAANRQTGKKVTSVKSDTNLTKRGANNPQTGQRSRLFTPQNRAKALERKGSKVERRGSTTGTSAGGKMATIESGELSFRSNEQRAYARDSEIRRSGREVSKKSKVYKALQSANIRNQVGELLNDVEIGDYVTAAPIETMGTGRNARARLYDRMSKGALKADEMDNINTQKLAADLWERVDDEVRVQWDPKDLKKAIQLLAEERMTQLRGRRLGGNSRNRLKVQRGQKK